MAAPTTPILDDFNRADESPLSDGGNWTFLSGLLCGELGGGGACAVRTNRCGSQPPFIGNNAYRTTTFNADQEVYCRVSDKCPADGGGEELALYARVTPVSGPTPPSGYAFWLGNIGWRCYEFSAGACTILTSGPWPSTIAGGGLPLIHVERPGGTITCSVGIYFWLRCEGDTIAGYTTDLTDSTKWFEILDSTHNNAGKIGLRLREGSMFWDDFGGGNL